MKYSAILALACFLGYTEAIKVAGPKDPPPTAADTPSSGYTTLVPPTTDSFEEKSLLLRVNAPGHDEAGTAKIRDILVPRAVNIGAFSMVHAKAPQKVTITIEYKVLKPNTGAPFAQIFKVIDTV